jgi:hypothetical protein
MAAMVPPRARTSFSIFMASMARSRCPGLGGITLGHPQANDPARHRGGHDRGPLPARARASLPGSLAQARP